MREGRPRELGGQNVSVPEVFSIEIVVQKSAKIPNKNRVRVVPPNSGSTLKCQLATRGQILGPPDFVFALFSVVKTLFLEVLERFGGLHDFVFTPLHAV